jgi:tetratricopeptide (TPR) repeat protein
LAVFAGSGCLWDYDTIAMERQQFPTVLELLSGKFLRHSPEFYYWRLRRREAELRHRPASLSDLDDMAVAYSKLGLDSPAIALMRQADALRPGRYETLANLGTFYLHSGRLEAGIDLIGKALEVNPDAHFGRERYQRLLAAYVLERRAGGAPLLPLQPSAVHPMAVGDGGEGGNFYHYLVREGLIDPERHGKTEDEGVAEALKGIAGMMRFGRHDSPVLLEALGDLLMQDGDQGAARQLAARAYLLASYRAPASKEAYREKAKLAVVEQYDGPQGKRLGLEEVEALFAEELAEGQAFYDALAAQEHAWILAGVDADSAYAAHFYQDPSLAERVQRGRGVDVNPGSIREGLPPASYRPAHAPVPLDSALAAHIDAAYGSAVPERLKAGGKGRGEGGDDFLVYLFVGTLMALLLLLRFRRWRMEGPGGE